MTKMTIWFYDKEGNKDYPEYNVIEIMMDNVSIPNTLYWTTINHKDEIKRHWKENPPRFKVEF